MQRTIIKEGHSTNEQDLKNNLAAVEHLHTSDEAVGILWIINKHKSDKKINIDVSTGIFMVKRIPLPKVIEMFLTTLNLKPAEMIDILKGMSALDKVHAADGHDCHQGHNHHKKEK